MNNSQTRQILQALLDGIDPITRKPLPDESPILQNPVYIALNQAMQRLQVDTSNAPAKPPARRIPIRSTRRVTAKWTDWSQAEQCLLIELHDAGMTLPELANNLRRSEDAVRVRLIGMGRFRSQPTRPKKRRPQAGKPWTPEERARLRELATTGISEAEMGRLLGRGEKSVAVQMVKLGIPPR